MCEIWSAVSIANPGGLYTLYTTTRREPEGEDVPDGAGGPRETGFLSNLAIRRDFARA